MGGIKFGWLAVWVLSPGWLSRKLEVCDVCQALRWSRLRRGVRAVPGIWIVYPGICLTTEEKSRTNHSQGNGRALDWPALNAICLVDLAIAGDGLDWPADPCGSWLSRKATWSTLVQRKYLQSCRIRGFPISANFESKLAVRARIWSANSGTPRPSCICLLLTYQGAPVARRRHLRCNTRRLWTWVRAADLHAEQHSPSWGGWAAYIAGLRSWRRDHSSGSGGDPAYPLLSSPLPGPIDVRRRGESCIYGHPQITGCVDPLEWFPEKCYWSGLDEAPSSMREDYRGALRNINGDSLFTQPPLQIIEVWLQVADEQRRLVGRGYDGRVICVEGQLDVVRGWWHVVDTQAEEDRGDQSTLSYPSPHAPMRWHGHLEGCFKCPIPEVGWDCMDYVRREVLER